MPVLDRRISLRGPRFWIDGDQLMFVNALDASTRDGPRLATNADREAHADAFARDSAGGEPAFKPLETWADDGRPRPEAPRPHADRRARAAEG